MGGVRTGSSLLVTRLCPLNPGPSNTLSRQTCCDDISLSRKRPRVLDGTGSGTGNSLTLVDVLHAKSPHSPLSTAACRSRLDHRVLPPWPRLHPRYRRRRLPGTRGVSRAFGTSEPSPRGASGEGTLRAADSLQSPSFHENRASRCCGHPRATRPGRRPGGQGETHPRVAVLACPCRLPTGFPSRLGAPAGR